MSIKKWSEDDRPREKFHLKGKNSCSNSELLAILIGMGNAEHSALDLSKIILDSVDNSFEKLSKKSIIELMKYKGIGLAKAVTIASALEIGNRKLSEIQPDTQKISCSRDGFNLLKKYFFGLKHEEFYVAFLSKNNKPIKIERISIGGTSSTIIDVKIIAKMAVDQLCAGIILSHNHPSGNMNPSDEDIKITKRVKEALKLFDIAVLDHLIIHENEYYSLIDNEKI